MTNNIVWLTVLVLGASLAAEGASPGGSVGNEIHSFNIPAEDAAAAIRDFGLQSGVPISAAWEDLQGKRLNKVIGKWSVDAALQKLIAGTGLRYTYDSNQRSVSVTAAPKQLTP
jgi:iron complex outermembrane recepter protein